MTSTQPQRLRQASGPARRLLALLIGLLLAVVTITVGAPNAAAQNGVGPQHQQLILTVGPGQSITPGDTGGQALPLRQLVSATGVAAEDGSGVGRTAARSCLRSFAGTTLVLMADGTKKPINDIKVGERVVATDPETGERVTRKVTHVWVHNDQVQDLVVDGEVITTTEDHLFWSVTDQRFEKADELTAGEVVLGDRGRQFAVSGFRPRTERTALAYNLSIDGVHTYHVGADQILVHNSCADGNPANEETLHSTLRGGERGIESSEVIKNAENMYYDGNGNQIYRWSQPDGNSQIVIRNPANGNIVTNQLSSNPWVEQQIQSGRWYDLQGG